ncbi:MAG: Cof-type HAD-IIB family hydrolase, partial [Chloroflexi bacterium]|nr:Cof-type HAD-IIB family hydrolase [Chloroflexota bacterium]
MTDVSLARSSYRLLVVDIDGTLLDKDGNISAEDRGALDMVRESGIMLALSTGRSALACRGVIDSLALDGYHIFFDGALVGCLESGHEVSEQPISPVVVGQMVDFAREH